MVISINNNFEVVFDMNPILSKLFYFHLFDSLDIHIFEDIFLDHIAMN